MHLNIFARRAVVFIAIIFGLFVTKQPALAANTASLQDYAGTWLLRSQGKNIMALQLKFAEDHISGTIVRPKEFHLRSGDLTATGPELKRATIVDASLSDGHLRLSTGTGDDDDRLAMTLSDRDHADLDKLDNIEKLTISFPLGTVQRAGPSDDVNVATDWPQRGPKNPSKEILDLQTHLKLMVDEDQAARKKYDGEAMQKVDAKNYPEIVRIYERYGWPRVSLVGEEAAGNYWLLVQHADAHKDFQSKLLPELKRAADEGDASKTDYAYLYDRVMVGVDKPQRYGTQGGACNKGKIEMRPIDDPAGLAERRKELHLMPMNQYEEILSSMCAREEGANPKK